MKHFLVYTLGRLGLFVLTYAVIITGVVVVTGDNSPSALAAFVSLVVAALLSSALSLKLLAGPRERFALSVQERAARAKERFEEIRAREDID